MDEAQVWVVTGPAQEPVRLDQAKLHMRVDHSEDDGLIVGLVTAAREQVEAMSRRALVTQTLELRLSQWPGGDCILLPRPPLASVVSVKYTDTAGVEQTFASTNYTAHTAPEPGGVWLKYNCSWPSAELGPGPSIAVRYTAGYGTAAAVPQRYKQAILLLAAHWYEQREAVLVSGVQPSVVPMAVEMLCAAERVSWF